MSIVGSVSVRIDCDGVNVELPVKQNLVSTQRRVAEKGLAYLAVAAILHAISPRFAIKSLFNFSITTSSP